MNLERDLAIYGLPNNKGQCIAALEKIKRLPFASQVKVFYSGFGMWDHNVRHIEDTLKT